MGKMKTEWAQKRLSTTKNALSLNNKIVEWKRWMMQRKLISRECEQMANDYFYPFFS